MEDQLTLSLAPPSPVPSTSTFSSLAPELKQAIFSALPDASTLSSLVLTCSTFYHTFRDAESLIIKSILHNQIGSHLLFDALIVLESWMLVPYNEEAVAHLLDLYAERALTITSNHLKWRLRHAVAISSLHDTIEYLSQDFACSALATNIVTGLDEPSPTPLSALESNRIKRTFYRFELFYGVFREREGHELNESKSETEQHFFFSMCEPWENEQLRCVRDYVFDRLRLPYNDVAEHDVEWGKFEQMRWLHEWRLFDENPFDRWAELYLSLGLSHLHRLMNTSTFDERCQLVKPRKRCPGYSLTGGLRDVRLRQEQRASENNQMDLNVDSFSTESALGSDRGPEEAWRWGTIDNGLWRYDGPQGTLQKRGYVMWDSARLAAWGLLDQDWHSIPYEEPVEPSQRLFRIADMENSYNARREIWDRGGRGWWSPGDESRVVWPPGGPIGVKEKAPDSNLGYRLP